jgi:hypothetical protein
VRTRGGELRRFRWQIATLLSQAPKKTHLRPWSNRLDLLVTSSSLIPRGSKYFSTAFRIRFYRHGFDFGLSTWLWVVIGVHLV